MKLSFTVPGTPVPKQRARRGKGGRFYTPEKTAAYEHSVQVYAVAAMARAGWPVRTRARCAVTVHVYWADARNRDIDNVFKALADGMNEVVFDDDRQIFEQHAFKHIDDASPRVDVEVTLLGEPPRSPPPRRAKPGLMPPRAPLFNDPAPANTARGPKVGIDR